MTLTYKFKKEKLENGRIVARPRILIRIKGTFTTIEVPVLIDTGCDVTVIPENLARAIGLRIKGKKTKLFAFRESTEVIEEKLDIILLGREERQNIIIKNVPVLISLDHEDYEDDSEVVLGIEGIFDFFDVTFKKSQNKIIFKPIPQDMKKQFKK
ncbi:hypothetical protein GOV08_03430 [Candidatus Woesearchaeota archaeon]|nr:hypothetical protein [Candidatus Woesearchaeota archaeon]